MDTPQLTPDLLLAAAAGLDEHDAVLGPAEDGGWWVLALRDPARAAVLRDVPHVHPDDGADTRRRSRPRRASTSATTATLRDVDTVADADAVAQRPGAPTATFARASVGGR